MEKKMKKWIVFILIVILAGCTTKAESLELKITNIKSSFSAFVGDPAYQNFGYDIRIENVSSVPIDLDYAEPVLSGEIKKRMKQANLKYPINGTMKKNDFFTLKGNFLFKADDLTKVEISSLKVIDGVMLYKKNGETYFVESKSSN